MSPKLTFFLTLLGVLAAGAPLLWLTRSPEGTAVQVSAETAVAEPVYATLRVTGTPSRMSLYLHGKLLAEVADELPWEGDVLLPVGVSAVEIEVDAAWPSPGEQAVTLTLEPTGQEARSCTRWADAASGKMHDVFHFVW